MNEIELKSAEGGVLLPVRAQPGARRNQIGGVHDGSLKVAVTQVPEGGKANKAIQKLLASELNVSKSRVQLVSGVTASRKVFRIDDLTIDELTARLAPFLS